MAAANCGGDAYAGLLEDRPMGMRVWAFSIRSDQPAMNKRIIIREIIK